MEWDDYLASNGNVLKNKLNITEPDVLDFIEKQVTVLKIDELKNEKIKDFSIESYKNIHKELFIDIYPESIISGQFRQVDMAKPEQLLNGESVNYVTHSKIEEYAQNALTGISQLDVSNTKAASKNLAIGATALFWVHPFREGNTRTLSVFLSQVANKNNLTLDLERLNENGDFRDHLVRSYSGDSSKLEKVLENAITIKNSDTYKGTLSMQNLMEQSQVKNETSDNFIDDSSSKKLKL